MPIGDPSTIDRVEFEVVTTTNQPLDIDWHPDGTGPYVTTKRGLFGRIGGGGSIEVLLDMSPHITTNSERGLLSVVFAPDGRHLYAHWSDRNGDNVLSAWSWPDTTGTRSVELNPDDRADIMVIDQPFANHNGGGLVFGPDGLLYWGQGDGGSGGDPRDHGQRLDTLLGTVVRIAPHPDGGSYEIPNDNPFTADEARPEIWVYGLRNPWRMSFDDTTGDLWLGDVGQDAFEEIDRLSPTDGGANLGWRCFEAFEAFAGCEIDDHHPPVVAYGRDLGVSVTGGVVVRDADTPPLFGNYVFGDFESGRLWALPIDSSAAVELPIALPGVVSFALDPDGGLWAASITTGEVGRLVVG